MRSVCRAHHALRRHACAAAYGMLLLTPACAPEGQAGPTPCPPKHCDVDELFGHPRAFLEQDDLAALQGCTILQGGLRIEGAHDLLPIACVEAITGPLSLIDTEILDVDPLFRLRRAGGIEIRRNERLRSVAGLGAIEDVGANGVYVQCTAPLDDDVSAFRARMAEAADDVLVSGCEPQCDDCNDNGGEGEGEPCDAPLPPARLSFVDVAGGVATVQPIQGVEIPGPVGRVLATTGDFDGDGALDVLVVLGTELTRVLDVSGAAQVVRDGALLPSEALAVWAVDLDGDLDDEVVAQTLSGPLFFFEAIQDGALVDRGAILVPFTDIVAFGDLDGDDAAEIVHGGLGIKVLQNAGLFSFDREVLVPQIEDPGTMELSAFALIDVDRDGRRDLLVTGTSGNGSAGGEIFTFTNIGDGRIGPRVIDDVGGEAPLYGSSDGFVDLDGDGLVDVLAQQDRRQVLARGQPAGGFAAAVELIAGSTDVFTTIGDLDGDDRLDLVNAHGFRFAASDGGYGPLVTFDAGTRVFAQTLGKFDAEGVARVVLVTTDDPCP